MLKLTLKILKSFSNEATKNRLFKITVSNIELSKHGITFMAWISSINLSTRFSFFNFKSSEPLQVKSIIILKKSQFSYFISSLAILSSQKKKKKKNIMRWCINIIPYWQMNILAMSWTQPNAFAVLKRRGNNVNEWKTNVTVSENTKPRFVSRIGDTSVSNIFIF